MKAATLALFVSVGLVTLVGGILPELVQRHMRRPKGPKITKEGKQ